MANNNNSISFVDINNLKAEFLKKGILERIDFLNQFYKDSIAENINYSEMILFLMFFLHRIDQNTLDDDAIISAIKKNDQDITKESILSNYSVMKKYTSNDINLTRLYLFMECAEKTAQKACKNTMRSFSTYEKKFSKKCQDKEPMHANYFNHMNYKELKEFKIALAYFKFLFNSICKEEAAELKNASFKEKFMHFCGKQLRIVNNSLAYLINQCHDGKLIVNADKYEAEKLKLFDDMINCALQDKPREKIEEVHVSNKEPVYENLP